MKKLRTITLWVVAVFSTLALLILGLLQVPAVQSQVIAKLMEGLSTSTGATVEVKHRYGFFPWIIEFDHLKLETENQLTAELNNVRLRWSPLALLRGRIVVKEALSEQLVLTLPEEKERSEPSTIDIPDLASLPDLKFDEISISDVTILDQQGNTLSSLILDAYGQFDGRSQLVTISLGSVDKSQDEVLLHISRDLHRDTFVLGGSVSLTKTGILQASLWDSDITSISATVEGDGPASDWAGRLGFVVDDVAVGEFGLRCRCVKDWELALNGDLKGSALDGINDLLADASALGVNLELAKGEPEDQVVVVTLDLEKGSLTSTTSGEVSLFPTTAKRIDFRLQGEVRGALLGIPQEYLPAQWSASGHLNSEGEVQIPTFMLKTTPLFAELSDAAFLSDDLMRAAFTGQFEADFLPPSEAMPTGSDVLEFGGDVVLSRDQKLTLTNSTVSLPERKITSSIEMSYDLTADRLGVLVETTASHPVLLNGSEFTIEEPIALNAEVKGVRSGGTANFSLALPQSTYNDYDIPPLAAKGHLRNWVEALQAEVAITATKATPSVTTADLALVYDASEKTGCLLSASANIAGVDFGGEATSCVEHAANTDNNKYQASTTLKQAYWLDQFVAAIALEAEWRAGPTGLSWAGKVSGTDLSASGVLVNRLTATAKGVQTEKGMSGDLSTFEVTLQSQDYELKQPAEFNFNETGVEISGLEIVTDDQGRAVVSELTLGDAIVVEGQLESFVLPVVPAIANGAFSINSKIADPEATVDVTLTSNVEGLPPSELELMSQWRKGVVLGHANLRVAKGSKEISAARFAEWRIPMSWSRGGEGQQWQVGAAEAKLTYDGAIDPILALLPTSAHELGGQLVMDSALSINSSGSNWSGTVALRDATYVYERGGVVLEDFDLSMEVKGQGLDLAGDMKISQNGQADKNTTTTYLIGSGQADFSSVENWQVALDVEMEDSPLLRHSYYEGTASGRLKLRANPKVALLEGHIHFDRVDLTIPPPGPKQVVDLKIVMVDDEGNPVDAIQNRESVSWLPELEIDLTLKADDRFILRGRGLEIEWQGQGKIEGPVATAMPQGTMDVVRGHIDFGGRQFNIEKGHLSLPKSAINDGSIEIVARHNVSDGTVARIRIEGTVGAPEISFESDPPKPKEEVVALVLFGKPLKDLGPMEALRTGAAIAQVSGRIGSFDGGILGRARQMIGIDYLNIDPQGGEGDTPIVTAGKYLGNGVFLKITEGLEEQQGAISLEYSITDEFTIKTEVGETSNTEGSILWERDY